MSVSFEQLKIGECYSRPYLAELWGYGGSAAISRGVITPAKANTIILFVTKEKQEVFPQYHDYIDDNILHWEGEEKHGSDYRIVNARDSNDEIHLFYRDIHHTDFTYHGKLHLLDYVLHSDKPSSFRFLINGSRSTNADILEDIESFKHLHNRGNTTEYEALVKSRIGQGQFRDGLISIWGGCSVTGLKNLSLLRASHIKPWRDCNNFERLDPMNGLLLHPAMDHLFDNGLATFDLTGRIRYSRWLAEEDAGILCLDSGAKLRMVPEKSKDYLRYHHSRVFQDSFKT